MITTGNVIKYNKILWIVGKEIEFDETYYSEAEDGFDLICLTEDNIDGTVRESEYGLVEFLADSVKDWIDLIINKIKEESR